MTSNILPAPILQSSHGAGPTAKLVGGYIGIGALSVRFTIDTEGAVTLPSDVRLPDAVVLRITELCQQAALTVLIDRWARNRAARARLTAARERLRIKPPGDAA